MLIDIMHYVFCYMVGKRVIGSVVIVERILVYPSF